MKHLRDPQTGCPWDIQQTFATIVPYTIEEAFEVADAIERGDYEELRDELGDLLFQVVFHAQMASEQNLFEFNDVVQAINEKLVRRHPHVFGEESIESAEAQTLAWEQHKEKEHQAKNKSASILEKVAASLPGLTRAAKLQKRAAKVGFDWNDIQPLFKKVIKELNELEDEVRAQADTQRIEEELGDLLFTAVNLSRHANVDPELAMRQANRKFERRFRRMEAILQEQGMSIQEVEQDTLEALWEQVKSQGGL
jgi:MazG family protein